MSKYLEIIAGKNAFSKIRENGLSPDMIDAMAGAAGGPKWIVLYGLDRAIASKFFAGRKKPLILASSSIGAWRFSAYCCRNTLKAFEKFREAYFSQIYLKKPSSSEVTDETVRIMKIFLSDKGIEEILSHPFFRMSFFASRSRNILKSEVKAILGAGLGISAGLNIISRRLLGLFFSRTVFYDKRINHPFPGLNNFNTERVKLDKKNYREALLASSSIPMVMDGVKKIHWASDGVYRDGGIIDYHMDIPFNTDGIVFVPHFMNRIVTGWFDKTISWRKPNSVNMKDILIVSPSKEFIKKLPYAKIPDRQDFPAFLGRDKERLAYWEKTIELSSILGDEFLELVESGKIKKTAKIME